MLLTAIQTSRDFSNYLALYNAAVSGDWETANTLFFEKNREETEAIISFDNETALHVAAQTGKANDFVRKLVALMSPQALAHRNCRGHTALHDAARVGNTGAAMAMLEIYPDLMYVLSFKNQLPVITAAKYSQKGTLKYLISVCKPNVDNTPFEGQLGIDLLIQMINNEFLGEVNKLVGTCELLLVADIFIVILSDVALDLVVKYPNLARLRLGSTERCALSIMAGMESVFPSRESFSWWEKLIYRCKLIF